MIALDELVIHIKDLLVGNGIQYDHRIIQPRCFDEHNPLEIIYTSRIIDRQLRVEDKTVRKLGHHLGQTAIPLAHS